MKAALLSWLQDAGTWVWQVSFTLFLLINAAAVGVVLLRRDRRLVDRWTGSWLGVNLGLLGVGLGVPLLTGLLRLALNALPTFSASAPHLK